MPKGMDAGVPTEGAIEPIFRKFRAFQDLDSDTVAFLNELQRSRHFLAAGTDLVVEGEASERVYVLKEGWSCSYKVLEDGRRQILTFGLPGDFLGLRNSLFETADHSIQALTDVVVASFSVGKLMDICSRCPEFILGLQWSAAREQAMLSEHLVSLGRRSAYQRVAHLLLELLSRLRLVGLADTQSYRLPLTQEILADTLGLSIVHVNRTLRKLRERGLVRMQQRLIVIPDIARLSVAASFEEKYLDQTRRTGARPVQ